MVVRPLRVKREKIDKKDFNDLYLKTLKKDKELIKPINQLKKYLLVCIGLTTIAILTRKFKK